MRQQAGKSCSSPYSHYLKASHYLKTCKLPKMDAWAANSSTPALCIAEVAAAPWSADNPSSCEKNTLSKLHKQCHMPSSYKTVRRHVRRHTSERRRFSHCMAMVWLDVPAHVRGTVSLQVVQTPVKAFAAGHGHPNTC